MLLMKNRSIRERLRRQFVAVPLAGVASLVATTALAAPTAALPPTAPSAHECATASEDAITLRKQEKLTAAKDRLLVCTNGSCPAEIRDECGRRLTEVSGAMPSIVFDVKDAAGNDVSGVRVSVDGVVLVEHAGTSAIPIDPGEHTFRFDGSDASQSVEKKFIVRDGEKNRILAVAFAGGSPPAAAPLAPVAAPPAPPPAAASESTGASTLGAQKIGALAAGGIGVVGIVVGAVAGGVSFSTWHNAENECKTSCGPNSQAQNDKGGATTAATISTASFIVSGVLLAGAGVLWFTAPSGAHLQVAPAASTQGGSLTLKGTF
jgi:hypothetical protein